MIFLFFRNTGSCSCSISSECWPLHRRSPPAACAAQSPPGSSGSPSHSSWWSTAWQSPPSAPQCWCSCRRPTASSSITTHSWAQWQPFFLLWKIVYCWYFLLLPWCRMYRIAISGCGQLNTCQTGSFCPMLMKFCLLQPETYTETEKKTAGRWDRHGRYNINKYTGQVFPRILYLKQVLQIRLLQILLYLNNIGICTIWSLKLLKT